MPGINQGVSSSLLTAQQVVLFGFSVYPDGGK